MNEIESPAGNERFCVIAAGSPQIIQCKLASYYPAGSSVEAATTQSRHYVRRQRVTAQRETTENDRVEYKLTA